MADDKKDERDELDEDESDEDQADEDEASDEDDEDQGDDEEEADEDEASDEEEADASDEDQADEDEASDEDDEDQGDEDPVDPTPAKAALGGDNRAADVARALGVGEEEEAGEDEQADAGPRNRADRRRQRALRRRAGRAAAAEVEAEPAARDRNVRKRDELLKRRRQAAEAKDEELPGDRLLPSEMVDDALARGGAATVKWLRHNWSWLQWALAAAVVGGVGFMVYVYYSTSTTEEASDTLAGAVRAEEGVVIDPAKDDRTEEQRKIDPRKVYATHEERDKAALEGYRKVSGEWANSGAGILAKLGEAGMLLDRREWDGAIANFDAVLGTELAAADPDVKGRALEGKGFAQEGKGELDAAVATFTQLAELPDEGFKVASLYHRARVLLAQQQKDKAKDLLVEARTQLEKAKLDARVVQVAANPYRWLDQAVEEALLRIDPSAAVAKPPGGMPALPDDIKRQLQEQGINPGLPTP